MDAVRQGAHQLLDIHRRGRARVGSGTWGEAELDLDVISVTVGFGSDGALTGKDPIGWAEFHEKYLVAGDPAGETMNAAVVTGLLTADVLAGHSPGAGTPTDPWRVSAEFAHEQRDPRCSNVVAGTVGLDHHTTAGSGTDESRGRDVQPHVDGRRARRLRRDRPSHSHRRPSARRHLDRAERRSVTRCQGSVRVRRRDPGRTGAHRTARGHGETHAGPRGPLRPLPFIDEIKDRQEFAADVADADSYIAAQPTDSEAILLAAAGRLARADSFSARTFAGDRVAPPRLAPLGEGMVDVVKPAVDTAPVANPPPPPPDPVPGPLQLHALLRAPSAKRLAVTSEPRSPPVSIGWPAPHHRPWPPHAESPRVRTGASRTSQRTAGRGPIHRGRR